MVDFTINGYLDQGQIANLDVATLLHYLRASHEYFMKFQLPTIRKELEAALDLGDNLAKLILKLYDNYMHSIVAHMTFEERTFFPYVQRLLDGQTSGKYNIDTISKHHSSVTMKLKELKSIIIKNLPADGLRNNRLTAMLYDLYNNEEWLNLHSEVEDNIFHPFHPPFGVEAAKGHIHSHAGQQQCAQRPRARRGGEHRQWDEQQGDC